MRYLSALIFAILGTYIGYLFGEREKKRQNELMEFLDIFEKIRNKIAIFSMPTRDIFISLDTPILKKYGFFDELNENGGVYTNRWETAVEKIKKRLSLYENEIEIIKSFGKNIGAFSKEIQIKIFDDAISSLQKAIHTQKNEIAGKIKAYRALGFAMGAILGILFI